MMIGRPPKIKEIELAKKYRREGWTFKAIGKKCGVDKTGAFKFVNFPDDRLEAWKSHLLTGCRKGSILGLEPEKHAKHTTG